MKGYDDLTSLGTSSFTGGEDGLVLATLYHVKQAQDVSGLRIMLTATGNTAGGEIIASLSILIRIPCPEKTATVGLSAG